ncbi:MAG TPA: hypothetical protein VK972_05020, partial [Wenzhouxiangella sp.]|nr:hypothetical protein [Wenzhouxiangella sp.]
MLFHGASIRGVTASVARASRCREAITGAGGANRGRTVNNSCHAAAWERPSSPSASNTVATACTTEAIRT